MTEAVQKYAVLQSVIKPRTFEIFHSLASPAKPNDWSFEEIIAIVKNHFTTTLPKTVRYFHFNRRNQSAYNAEMSRLSLDCNFARSFDFFFTEALACMGEALQMILIAK